MNEKEEAFEKKMKSAERNLERIKKKIGPFIKIRSLKTNETTGQWTVSRYSLSEQTPNPQSRIE